MLFLPKLPGIVLIMSKYKLFENTATVMVKIIPETE